jgi:hypothetical protein
VEDAPSVEMFARYIERESYGGLGWAETFIGKIADVMLWDRVLSDAEIATLVR